MTNEKTVFQNSCINLIEALHAERRGEITKAQLDTVSVECHNAEQHMYAAGFQIGRTAPHKAA